MYDTAIKQYPASTTPRENEQTPWRQETTRVDLSLTSTQEGKIYFQRNPDQKYSLPPHNTRKEAKYLLNEVIPIDPKTGNKVEILLFESQNNGTEKKGLEAHLPTNEILNNCTQETKTILLRYLKEKQKL